MIYGLDHLGGAKYADLAAREHPVGFAFGVFWNVDGFGSAENLIKRVAKEGRAPILRVHGVWKDDHRFGQAEAKKAIEISKRLEAISMSNKNIEFRYSPFCEHNVKANEMLVLMQQIKRVAPSLKLVNTPMHNVGAILPDYINEFHGTDKKPKSQKYQFSFDGTSAEDADVEAYKKSYENAEIFFLWSPRFNGRWEDNDKTPRPQRKGYPDSTFIDSIIYLARQRGDCRLDRNHLYKSHSENKGNGDPRAEKPVYIAPVRARSVELVADNMQVVDTLKYYGTFSDGRFRYYAQSWGYQIAEKAVRIQHYPIVTVRINGKIHGKINSAFRYGTFR